ncbi:MAG: hypothetical protein SFX19_01675 [Alphaproteobacteria bacterium]|nr:hypothetical protein [Alphaproteobacteria bacterium]
MHDVNNTYHFPASANATFLQWVQATRALSHDDMEEIFDHFGQKITALAEKTGAQLNTNELIHQFKLTLKSLIGNRGIAMHGYLSNPDLLR